MQFLVVISLKALLLDLDRTLVDLQSFTNYSAALADVQDLVGEWSDVDVPTTDWDRATMSCMSVLHAFFGDARWRQFPQPSRATSGLRFPSRT